MAAKGRGRFTFETLAPTFSGWLANPVAGRELLCRFRGWRFHAVVAGYALGVSLCFLAAYWLLVEHQRHDAAAFPTSRYPIAPPSAMSGAYPAADRAVVTETARNLWLWGCAAQALLLALIVPAFTCGSISREREHHQLDLLLLTQQSPLRICIGKLAAGVGVGWMLLLTALPPLSIPLFLGGVSPEEIGACLAVLVTTGLLCGALGLAASSVWPRTMTASAVTYAVIGAWLVGIPLLGWFLSVMRALSYSGSELSVIAVLAALIPIAFPVALLLAIGIYRLRRKRVPRPPTRAWWMLTLGGSEAVVLLLQYLPGVPDVLFAIASPSYGDFIALKVHPPSVIRSVMTAAQWERWGALGFPPPATPQDWIVCSLACTAAASWLFLVAWLRVREMRVR